MRGQGYFQWAPPFPYVAYGDDFFHHSDMGFGKCHRNGRQHKSREYGLPGRTAFSIYRIEERDKIALLWLLFCGFYIGCGAFLGGLK